MHDIILNKLTEIESTQQVKILYACESGSRAWGFHSPDSDYDVRFIYVHHKDWYLSIEDKKDHIDFPVSNALDLVGYDLRKMLKLFRSSNAKIYEWLQSPIAYIKDDFFLAGLLSFIPSYYSLRAGIHHYLGLTRNTYDNDLQKDQVKLKKYFYALRPVLAARWIVEKQECPPMEFHQLRTIIRDENINEQIEQLLQQKILVDETYLMEPHALLNEFIRVQMDYCMEASAGFQPKQTEVVPLNKFFRQTIGL